MENKIIAVIVIAALVLLGGYVYINSGAEVSASGNSVVKAQPDEIVINMMVQGKGKTTLEAKEQHDKIYNSLVAELEKQGFAKSSIETESFSVYEDFDWSGGKQVSKGFIANQMITVKVASADKISPVIDAAIKSGSLVSYINFQISQEKRSEYKAQALKEAGEDARVKAEATAAGLGKNVGRLVSVESQNFDYGIYPLYARSEGSFSNDAAKEAVANMNPGNVDVTATVNVRYKLRAF